MNPCMKNPVALITGGGRGIGRAISLALARRGCLVGINFRSNEESAILTKELIEGEGGKAFLFKADCTCESEVIDMFSKIRSDIGGVSILVNNAGKSHDKLLLRTTLRDYEEIMDANLKSSFLCSREAIRSSMLPNRSGRIVNIASVVGVIGNKGQAPYSASKAGLIGLSKSVAKEYASRGILVNCICPGFIDTDMTWRVEKDRILDSIPLGRYGKTEEVAGLVEYLSLSPSAQYITGQSFIIDGGLSLVNM